MPEGLLLVVWSSIGLWVVGWVRSVVRWDVLKKLDQRTTLNAGQSLQLATTLRCVSFSLIGYVTLRYVKRLET